LPSPARATAERAIARFGLRPDPPAAEDADAIIDDSRSNRVFTFNGDVDSSTVIDPRSGTLQAVEDVAVPGSLRRWSFP
jgi:hypothetical protein